VQVLSHEVFVESNRIRRRWTLKLGLLTIVLYLRKLQAEDWKEEIRWEKLEWVLKRVMGTQVEMRSVHRESQLGQLVIVMRASSTEDAVVEICKLSANCTLFLMLLTQSYSVKPQL
jgi:hypothetical protein